MLRITVKMGKYEKNNIGFSGKKAKKKLSIGGKILLRIRKQVSHSQTT
jgi:hypothetical protein